MSLLFLLLCASDVMKWRLETGQEDRIDIDAYAQLDSITEQKPDANKLTRMTKWFPDNTKQDYLLPRQTEHTSPKNT